MVYNQVTEPLWEAKTEFEIGRALAQKLGMNPDELWPISEKQAFFNQIATSTYNNYNCNYEKYDGEALVPDCELPQRAVEVA